MTGHLALPMNHSGAVPAVAHRDDRAHWRAAVAIVASLLVVHVLTIFFSAAAHDLSIMLLTAAPLIAGASCLVRGHADGHNGRWHAVALAMALWAGGMAANLVAESFFANASGVSAASMLLFVLFDVPLAFVAASPANERPSVRAIDGLLALTLGMLFFALITSLSSTTGASDAGVAELRAMFDVENIFVALFCLARAAASNDPADRDFFGRIAMFGFAYLATAAYINHCQAGTDYGGPTDLIIDLPFLLLALLAARRPRRERGPVVPRALDRAIATASPLILPAPLLMVSGALIGAHPALAVGGFVVATMGYGVRSVLVQISGDDRRAALEHLSLVDALTGLANRRQFDDRLARAITAPGAGVALLMADIDHFKALNDGLGHPVGDQRLREVATALDGCRRGDGDLVARYGGEEFAVVLCDITLPEARGVAEAMRSAVEQRRLPSVQGATVTISVGLAMAGPGGEGGAATLLGNADAALYAAKAAGRNRVVAHLEAIATAAPTVRQGIG